MKKKIVLPFVLALILALVFSVPGLAAGPEQTDSGASQARLKRLGGVVVSVNTSDNTLEFKPQRGAQLTLTADDKTRYAGAANSLVEIKPGMQAVIAAHREEGGIVRLVGIFTRNPLERYRGRVEAVDTTAETLTLTTREGKALTFKVDDKTRYNGYKIAVESLEDIQPGMWAGILASRSGDGMLLARAVLAASVDELPRFEVRMGGKVTAVSDESFTIENRKGEEVTFQVAETTRIRSRDGNVTKLNQLKEGMLVLVGAQTLDDGGFLAKGVLVVQRKP